MTQYGLWKERIEVDGINYQADLIAEHHAKRAGLKSIYALNGIPTRFKRDIINASQVCQVPHTWRVAECQSEEDITEDIFERAKSALDKDIKELNSHIITYLGTCIDTNAQVFLAAGAIRNKLTKDYQNDEFPVVSRAIVAPSQRGKGLGSLIVEHRIKASLHFFTKRPKGIHFGTESKQILHSIKNIEKETNLKFVYIGDETYQASDGAHTVSDYLCFLPWYQEALLAAVDNLKKTSSNSEPLLLFRKKLISFMRSGIEELSGAYLEELFCKLSNNFHANFADDSSHAKSLALLSELFMIKNKIGAHDPAIKA